MRFRKPELIPLLFIIAAVGTCVVLGAWQLERLAWKEGLIAQIDIAQRQPVLTELPVPHAMGRVDYRRVELTGFFQHDKTLYQVGPGQRGKYGFFVLTPFETDGRTVLVNRGWSPKGQESTPGGQQTITGIIRPPRGKRAFFIADNQPEQNVWLYEDIAQMAAATGLSLEPMVVEAVGPKEAGVYPEPNDGSIRLRNDHLGYAITWFSLAVVGLVCFGFYYREKPCT